MSTLCDSWPFNLFAAECEAQGGQAVPKVQIHVASLLDKLDAAGLRAGQKPSAKVVVAVTDVLAVYAAEVGLSAQQACILSAWLGGAHDRDDPKFLATSEALSAQTACGVGIWSTASVYIWEILQILRDNGQTEAADLLQSAGKATAKKSADKQDAEAKSDAVELAKVAGFGAIGIGAIVALVVLAVIIAKGKLS